MSVTKQPGAAHNGDEHQEREESGRNDHDAETEERASRVYSLHEGRAQGKKVAGGPFPPKRRHGEHEQGESRSRHVPTAKAPHALKQPSPHARILNADDPSADDHPDPVIFFTYTSSGQVGPKTFTNAADISGADSRRGVVLLSGNWYCDYSVDGGATFTRADPTTIFPPGLANGFCCDQIVHYVPSIDRFVWFMQHNADANGGAFRLAVASPGDIVSNFASAWTYWDFRARDFGLGTADMDYPDLSFSDSFLFLSTDALGTSGRFVARLPLPSLAAGGTIGFQYTDPTKAIATWGGHLVQGSGDAAYWAGHKDNATIQLFSMPDAGSTYASTDIVVATWPNGTLSSLGPNGNDWLQKENSFPDFAITGGTRGGNRLWLAWTASAGSDGHGGFTFPNTHVRVAEIDLGSHLTVSEIQIWNPDYAFAYPALARNARGEIGITLGWGGKNNDADAAVGILGDYVVWYRNGSDITTLRWGDYVTVRPAQRNEGLFAGFGYYTLKDPATTTRCSYTPYYVVFGRKSLGG